MKNYVIILRFLEILQRDITSMITIKWKFFVVSYDVILVTDSYQIFRNSFRRLKMQTCLIPWLLLASLPPRKRIAQKVCVASVEDKSQSVKILECVWIVRIQGNGERRRSLSEWQEACVPSFKKIRSRIATDSEVAKTRHDSGKSIILSNTTRILS